jgi:hypothetical protein
MPGIEALWHVKILITSRNKQCTRLWNDEVFEELIVEVNAMKKGGTDAGSTLC